MLKDQAKTKRGPKTEEGKKRSSLNALKHGLTAESQHAFQALAEESGVEYEPILDRVRSCYWPTDQMEDILVKRMARCLWRLAQMEAMERRLFDRYSERSKPGTSYEAVLKCERMVSLELHRCIRTLIRKRDAENKKSPGNELYPRSI